MYCPDSTRSHRDASSRRGSGTADRPDRPCRLSPRRFGSGRRFPFFVRHRPGRNRVEPSTSAPHTKSRWRSFGEPIAHSSPATPARRGWISFEPRPRQTTGDARWPRGGVRRRSWRFRRANAARSSRLLERHRDARVLVFTGDNETAYGISRQHLIMPLTCDIGPAERTDTITRFREGKLRALVSSSGAERGIRRPRCRDCQSSWRAVLGSESTSSGSADSCDPRPVSGRGSTSCSLCGTSDVHQAARMREALAPRRPSAA